MTQLTTSNPGGGRNVLVAEDDPMLRKLIRILLEQSGFRVVTAEDGQDALEKARLSPPDAIVSDMLMPRLDGFKLCLHVRQDPRLARVPVVLTSAAFVEDADRKLAESVGANRFIPRTPSMNEVIQGLLEVLAAPPSEPAVGAARFPTAEYADRVSRQLERQAALTAHLARRLEWMEAKLALLTSLTESLERSEATDSLVDDILRRALEASGASRGAAYLLDQIGQPVLRAVFGYPAGSADPFAGSGLLRDAIARRALTDLSLPGLTAVAPLVSGEKALGALALTWDGEQPEEGWRFFISVIAGQASQAAALARALSALREKEEERERLLASEQEARNRAEAAVKARDDFISVAAHELKTPVASLKGYAQLVRRSLERTGSVDSGRLARAMETIDQQSTRLARLTEQMLDLSRLQAGKLILSPQRSDLVALVEGAVSAIRLAHPGGHIELCSDGPIFAPIDPLRIEQVFTNLLDNAIKFSSSDAPIEVAIGADSGQTGASAWVSVRDHGIGVREDQRERIFERFHQADEARRYGGMGIGLFVSRQIVDLHGGTIYVEQPEGQGSRFVVRLPIGGDSL